MDQLVEEARGAVLMTAHIGAPCAALVALAVKGFPMTHVSREYAEHPDIPRAFRRFALKKIRLIERKLGRPLVNVSGHRPLHAHRTALEIGERLRRHQLVSMALDVNPGWVSDRSRYHFLGKLPVFLRIWSKSQRVPVFPSFPTLSSAMGSGLIAILS